MDCSPPGSSAHGVLQARILEWVAFPSPRDFPEQGSNPGLPHCSEILYHLSHQRSPHHHSYLNNNLQLGLFYFSFSYTIINYALHYEINIICYHDFTLYLDFQAFLPNYFQQKKASTSFVLSNPWSANPSYWSLGKPFPLHLSKYCTSFNEQLRYLILHGLFLEWVTFPSWSILH